MPFTLAHPVAVLPLRRPLSRIPFSALVIGSMTPDFPYFLLLHSSLHHIGHSYTGIVTFDLPAGLLAFLIFHGLLKMPLLALMPKGQREKLYPVAWAFRLHHFVDFLAIVCGVLVGVLSHLALDSFTHSYGWPVRHCALLTLPLLTPRLPVFKALQYSGSIVGMWALYVAYRRWLRALPSPVPIAPLALSPLPSHRVGARMGVALVLLSCVVGIGYEAKEHRRLHGHESRKKVVSIALEAGMACGSVGITSYCTAWQIAHRREVNASS